MGGGGNLPIGPGVWGFIAAFVLALALWLLMRNMNSRMRRMAYRERERLEREALDAGSPDEDRLGTAAADGTSPDRPESPTGTGGDDSPGANGGADANGRPPRS